ncbi:hypothetical protein CDAR_396451 [Caerostris darwini]|uniref:Uncharacterized protein n=1 Tax=Caerostris darwini TaxID=1538125 RepID=A0AAV4T0P9_9ARAC|nr:hypothetical protein CDAR_396451 [Caerostris darwini]
MAIGRGIQQVKNSRQPILWIQASICIAFKKKKYLESLSVLFTINLAQQKTYNCNKFSFKRLYVPKITLSSLERNSNKRRVKNRIQFRIIGQLLLRLRANIVCPSDRAPDDSQFPGMKEPRKEFGIGDRKVWEKVRSCLRSVRAPVSTCSVSLPETFFGG